MNDTLYVSALDGTLMRNDEKLSENTVKTLNELLRQGLPSELHKGKVDPET